MYKRQIKVCPVVVLLRMELFFMNKFRHGVLLTVSMVIIILISFIKISVIEFIIKKLLTVS